MSDEEFIQWLLEQNKQLLENQKVQNQILKELSMAQQTLIKHLELIMNKPVFIEPGRMIIEEK